MGLIDIIKQKTGRAGAWQRLVDDPAGQALVASIMVVAANSDGGISPDENLRMVQLLREGFGLSPGEALELVTRLADTGANAIDMDELVNSVNQEFSGAEKEELILMVLKVISADRKKDAAEMQLLTTLADDLQISEKNLESAYSRYFARQNQGR